MNRATGMDARMTARLALLTVCQGIAQEVSVFVESRDKLEGTMVSRDSIPTMSRDKKVRKAAKYESIRILLFMPCLPRVALVRKLVCGRCDFCIVRIYCHLRHNFINVICVGGIC